MEKKVYTLDYLGKKLQVEVGEVAKQADGAVLIRYEESVILSTVVCSDQLRDFDYFPLTVEYQEKMYSVGKIPGGFLRREGRSGEHATLTGRMIDRTLRPLFPEGMRNEVQLINTVLSVDPDSPAEMAAMISASLAVGISDIPFDGPIAGVNVGRVNGELIINPDLKQRAASDLELTVAGTKDAVNMVEAAAGELSEEEIIDAIFFAHEAIKQLCDFQQKIIDEIGKEKREVPLRLPNIELIDEVKGKANEKLQKAISTFDKLERQRNVQAVFDEVLEQYAELEYESEDEKAKALNEIKVILENLEGEEIRRLITEEKTRPDGRGVDEVRPLTTKVDLLPRTHGSALFTRGQTQTLSTVTLGPKSAAQMIDDSTEEETRRFMHHYNFPPYSVGDVRRLGGVGRREIGHGKLGEKALLYVIPDEEEFPYTIRVVSEVLESNGSSSQASICSASMALMAAGVPIKDMVTGIAMGLVTTGNIEDGAYTILTDIQGIEDAFGDMDFKVAGTSKGITALQMDIKIAGVTKEVLSEALAQAKVAREQIRAAQLQAISEPRPDVGKYAPKMDTFMIDPERIGEVIGTGGKVINEIIENHDDCKIDIEDSGQVAIYHMDRETINRAKKTILDILKEAKVGEVYEGVVNRIEDYGAFVNIFGNTDGLLHVSRMAYGRTNHPSDVVAVGDTIKVKVIEVDDRGKVGLSHREFLEKPEGWVENGEDNRPSRGRGRRRSKDDGKKVYQRRERK